ncbi:hypothetical protein ACI2IV_11710 [Psychrobacter faecalis]
MNEDDMDFDDEGSSKEYEEYQKEERRNKPGSYWEDRTNKNEYDTPGGYFDD